MTPPSTGCNTPAVDANQARWFAEEVHVHDAQLKAFVRGTFPVLPDVEDVVQESYLRVWRACTLKPIHSARAFLFTVARRVALNLVERQRTSPVHTVPDLSAVVSADEAADGAELASRREKVRLLVEAMAQLPPRCREIVIRCKIQRCSYREVAEALHLSEKTVAEQVSRGVKRCHAYLAKHGVTEFVAR